MSLSRLPANPGDIHLPSHGACAITFPFRTAASGRGINVVQASDWSMIVRHKPGDADTTVVTPTMSVDTTRNTVTATFSAAQIAALIEDGQGKWAGYWQLYNSSRLQPYVGSRLIIDRNGTRPTGDVTTPIIAVDGIEITVEVLSAEPLPRYLSPKGPRLAVVGTSIDLGSGGDYTYNAVANTYSDGYPSNASIYLHAAAQSEGRLRLIKNSAVGGDWLGGVAYFLDDAEIGAETVDVGFTYTDADGNVSTGQGPHLPFAGVSFFTDYGWTDVDSTGDDVESFFCSGAPTEIDGGVRVTLLTPTTKAHSAGDEIRWGMIGAFPYNVARFEPDIVAIGGPTNDVASLTTDELLEGVLYLAQLAVDCGAVPVLSTICARSTYQDEVDAFNVALRGAAVTYGQWHWDPYRPSADPATRALRAIYSFDGTHPNQEGAQVLGAAFLEDFADRAEIRRDSRRRASVDGYGYNCAPNGTFSSGSSGTAATTFAPTGWSDLNFFGGGMVKSLEAPEVTDPIEGNLFTITASGSGNGGTRGISAAIPIVASGHQPAWAQGDKVSLSAFLRLKGFNPDGNCMANVQLLATGTGGSVAIPLIYNWIRDFEGQIINEAQIIPAGVGTLTALALRIYLVTAPSFPNGTGSGILQVGEISLFNMTAGGF